MGKLFSRFGGTKRKLQLTKWKDGKESMWDLEVNEGEVNRQLLKRKRVVETQLDEELSKRKKMEVEVKALRKTSKNQAKVISRLKTGRSEKSRGSSLKPWNCYSRQQQYNKKKTLARSISGALSFCEDEGFKPCYVEIENIETESVEVLNLSSGTFSTKRVATVNASDKVHSTLLVKDKFAISNKAFHELSMLSDLPSSNEMKKLSHEINSQFDVHPTPNGIVGVQHSLRARLLIRLSELINISTVRDDQVPTTFRIKLTGDGTQIARGLTVVNIAFTILEEGQRACSASGNHSIAIMKISENYDDLVAGLKDICDEARDLEVITLNGNTYTIEFYLGGDWKFLAMVCGLDSATSQYACIWCKCPKQQRYDMTMTWSLTDPVKGARTIEEIKEKSKFGKTSKYRFNCSREPIFPFIPLHRVVIDSLHLFLRIADVLINLLIRDLRIIDGIDKAINIDLKKVDSACIKKYEYFLNKSCKIRFQWYVDKESKKLKWRDLTGPEKIRLFTIIDIPALFPSLETKDQLQELWTEFFKLSQSLDVANATEFSAQAKGWIQSFLSVYQSRDVTPYMHAFAMHVPEFLSLHGNLVSFTQQGLEKLNDITTQHFQRSSNHRDSEALKQILEKWNRIETLEDSGFARDKRVQVCSICKISGHNKRSCSAGPLQELDVNVINPQ